VVTSHQTYTRAQVDSDPFFHPNISYGNPQVAVEAIDTRWHTYPFTIKIDGNPSLGDKCQPYENYHSLVCRRSDMALLKPVGAPKSSRGYLIRPAKRYTDKYPKSDQFAVKTDNPYMQIESEVTAGVGYTVDKIGIKTGWRVGRVTRVCVDIARYASELRLNIYVLRCQTELDIYGEAGDSGGPVFIYNGTNGTARLAGLYHGGSSFSPGDYRYYSPLANIRNDLGLRYDDTATFRVTP